MGSGGKSGIQIVSNTSGRVKELPIVSKDGLDTWEKGIKNNDYETAVVFDKDGVPVFAFEGDAHSVAIPQKATQVEGGVLTHNHPDKYYGGTLSEADIRNFANSKLDEMRAVQSDGTTYILRAKPNLDRDKLRRYINKNQKLMQKNFEGAYTKALKQATAAPIASGKNKGKIKLTVPSQGKTITKYVNPMTPEQAQAYARTYSVGIFNRTYKKNLNKYGVEYVVKKSKAGSNKPNTATGSN